MIWYVYDHDINRREIKTYNVFKHHSFREDVEKLLKENLTYEEFDEKLNRIAQYYFWSRAEYEIVLTSWVPHIDNEELDRLNKEREEIPRYRLHAVNLEVGEKVDFYDQLHLNWEQFTKYVYGFTQLQKDNRGKDI